MKKRFTAEVILKNFVIPSAVLLTYFGSFLFLSHLMHIEGVNTAFANRISKYLLAMMLLEIIVLLIVRIKSLEKIKIDKIRNEINIVELIFLFLPLTPVLQYIITNSGILLPKDIAAILGFFIVFSLLYIVIIPFALSFLGTTKTLMALGIAFTTTITSMALLSKQFNWFLHGSLKIQLLYFSVIFLLAYITLNRKDLRFVYWLVLFYFLTNSTIQFINKSDQLLGTSHEAINREMSVLLEDKKPVFTPNIYLLVYDSYICLLYTSDAADE